MLLSTTTHGEEGHYNLILPEETLNISSGIFFPGKKPCHKLIKKSIPHCLSQAKTPYYLNLFTYKPSLRKRQVGEAWEPSDQVMLYPQNKISPSFQHDSSLWTYSLYQEHFFRAFFTRCA
jgi:hypothetical protein